MSENIELDLDFAAIFRDSPVPGMVLDKQLAFVAANAAYTEMVGKPIDALLGRHVFDVFPESEERVAAMTDIFNAAFQGERPAINEIPFVIEKDGITSEHWWTAHHAPLRNAAGEITQIVQFSKDVSQEVRARDLKDALMGEMQHRVGNLFAVVRAMARQTARRSEDLNSFLTHFDQGLASFFSAQKSMGADGAGTDIREVIEQQLVIFDDSLRASIRLDGPALSLGKDEAQAVSLALHELSTNALKYGALSGAGGEIELSWSAEAGAPATIVWHERGGPLPDGDVEDGYGSMLLLKMLPRQLGGTAERRFDADGMVYSVRWERRD